MSRDAGDRPTAGMTAEAFLARVRAGLGRSGPPEDAAPAVDERIVRRCHAGDDLAARFAEAARAAGMQVHPCRTEAVEATVAGVLAAIGARSVTISAGSPDLEGPVERAAAHASAAIVSWRDHEGLEAHYRVDAGITGVVAAIAETGSLVVSSGAARSRGAFLVPPVHVAVVEAAQIVPDLLDVWTGLDAAWSQRLPAALITITGPSKTADIEGILITGVHGPRAVHIVLVGG